MRPGLPNAGRRWLCGNAQRIRENRLLPDARGDAGRHDWIARQHDKRRDRDFGSETHAHRQQSGSAASRERRAIRLNQINRRGIDTRRKARGVNRTQPIAPRVATAKRKRLLGTVDRRSIGGKQAHPCRRLKRHVGQIRQVQTERRGTYPGLHKSRRRTHLKHPDKALDHMQPKARLGGKTPRRSPALHHAHPPEQQRKPGVQRAQGDRHINHLVWVKRDDLRGGKTGERPTNGKLVASLGATPVDHSERRRDSLTRTYREAPRDKAHLSRTLRIERQTFSNRGEVSTELRQDRGRLVGGRRTLQRFSVPQQGFGDLSHADHRAKLIAH